MLLYQQTFFRLFIIYIQFSPTESSSLLTKFNITLRTPSNTLLTSTISYKSVHVKHILTADEIQSTIVGFEPIVQIHRKTVQRLAVHLCNKSTYASISHNDERICIDTEPMLIYEWTLSSYLSPFHLSNNSGFILTNFKSIVLTVIYKKESQVQKEQSGVILYLSTQLPKFRMATMTVGNREHSTKFSCRSSHIPRLIYGVKKLNVSDINIWWRMYVIRIRQFRRKLVQLVHDSKKLSNISRNTVEIVPPDTFLMEGDYLLMECDNISDVNCYFLVYYNYKRRFDPNEQMCKQNDFSYLFKLLPSEDGRGVHQINAKNKSKVRASKILWLIVTLLLSIWMSIIIGCVIMRRIRGLANFRTENANSSSTQKINSLLTSRAPNDNYGQRMGEADQMMQIDVEIAGQAN